MSQVRDIMTTDVKAVGPETTLRELAEFLVAEEVSGAPVVSGGVVVGVVSATDLLEFDAENRVVPAYRERAEAGFGAEVAYEAEVGAAIWSSEEDDPPAAYFADLWEGAGADLDSRLEREGPDWDALDEHAVGEIMTRRVVSLHPTATVRDAAALMILSGVHRLLVLDGEELVGLVSTTDIMQAVAQRGLG